MRGKKETFHSADFKFEEGEYKFSIRSDGGGASCKNESYLTDDICSDISAYLLGDNFSNKFEGRLEILNKGKLKEKISKLLETIMAKYKKHDY